MNFDLVRYTSDMTGFEDLEDEGMQHEITLDYHSLPPETTISVISKTDYDPAQFTVRRKKKNGNLKLPKYIPGQGMPPHMLPKFSDFESSASSDSDEPDIHSDLHDIPAVKEYVDTVLVSASVGPVGLFDQVDHEVQGRISKSLIPNNSNQIQRELGHRLFTVPRIFFES